MELLMLLLRGKDLAALICAGALGYLAGRLVPSGWPSICISILLSYHLFLAWLLLTSECKVAISLSAVESLGTHLACLAIVLSLGMGRLFIPFFDVVCCFFAGLAFFERDWLFRSR
jgi:hypothetical protein